MNYIAHPFSPPATVLLVYVWVWVGSCMWCFGFRGKRDFGFILSNNFTEKYSVRVRRHVCCPRIKWLMLATSSCELGSIVCEAMGKVFHSRTAHTRAWLVNNNNNPLCGINKNVNHSPRWFRWRTDVWCWMMVRKFKILLCQRQMCVGNKLLVRFLGYKKFCEYRVCSGTF